MKIVSTHENFSFNDWSTNLSNDVANDSFGVIQSKYAGHKNNTYN